MSDNKFQLAGKVNVPAEKKDEMNQHVLEIMYKCGIRKTVEMTVAGEKVTVVEPVRPNGDGIVLFDYSIFEKKKREISSYNLNTCELHTEDRGYNEFGIVMNMIMVLQEAYTNGGCYFTESGKLCDIGIYLFLLQGVLGERIALPARLVFAYAQAVEMDFWEIWDSLGSQGYSDIIRKNIPKDAETDFRSFPFYKAIQRKNEDEFLEFWDGSNLILSQDMKECIRRWKERFSGIRVHFTGSTEHFLAEIIVRLERSYCRYVDKTFVTEFMEHRDESNYQKVLILLQQLLDKGQEYFPELIGEQADEWIIQGARDRFDYIEISAFASLLTNKRQRNIVFRF